MTTFLPSRVTVPEIDKWLEDFLSFTNTVNTNDSYPFIDVYVTGEDKTLNVEFALAGFKKEDISIEINGNRFTVSGKKADQTDDERKYIQKRIAHRSFSKSWYVPEEYDLDKMKAEFDSGVLKLEIKKAPTKAVKILSIK